MILSQLQGIQHREILQNREFIGLLFDSLVARLPDLPDSLNLIVEAPDSALKLLVEERTLIQLASRGIEITDNSNRLLLRVVSFSLRFPVATKNGLFSPRIIRREAYAKIFVQISPNFNAYEDQEKITDMFPESLIEYVNASYPFTAYPEKRTLIYYLWEPVIIAVFTVGLAYIFFTAR